MLKKWSTILLLQVFVLSAHAQVKDSAAIYPKDTIPFEEYDVDELNELFNDLEYFLDSIARPHTYFLATVSVGNGYFNFISKNTSTLEASRKLTYAPTLGYYHKSGFGFTATGHLVDDEANLNIYQGSFTPSFDYLQNLDLATGISYSRFLTRDSLPFYTSPLQNEVYGYFTYRNFWLRPTVAFSYGWGSRSDYEEREELITSLRLRPDGYTTINTTESISDFSLITSLRHDFYWLDVLSSEDHIRFTPQLSFTSGTQKFGFNRKSNTYATVLATNSNVLYNSEDIYLDDQLDFQPLSLSLYLRGEYSFGKFFVQPQVMLDYYFPAEKNNFNTLLSLNAGFIF